MARVVLVALVVGRYFYQVGTFFAKHQLREVSNVVPQVFEQSLFLFLFFFLPPSQWSAGEKGGG